MAKNILTKDTPNKAKTIKWMIEKGYKPFFSSIIEEQRGFQTEKNKREGLLQYVEDMMPGYTKAREALTKIDSTIDLIEVVSSEYSVPKASTINRLNQFLVDIDIAKNNILKHPGLEKILTKVSGYLAISPYELTLDVKVKEDPKKVKSKGTVSQALSVFGLTPRSALGIGAISQLAAPALGPFFAPVAAGIVTADFLAKPTIWAGRMLGKGIGALAGVSLANRGGWRRGGGPTGGVSSSGVGLGIEQFMQKPFESQAPMAGLGQPTTGSPATPAMPTGPTDLSSAGRMLAMARWGKKDSQAGQPTSYEFSKNLEHFFDKRAYKARWTRDVAGYLKKMAGGEKVGEGLLGGLLGGGGGLVDKIKSAVAGVLSAGAGVMAVAAKISATAAKVVAKGISNLPGMLGPRMLKKFPRLKAGLGMVTDAVSIYALWDFLTDPDNANQEGIPRKEDTLTHIDDAIRKGLRGLDMGKREHTMFGDTTDPYRPQNGMIPSQEGTIWSGSWWKDPINKYRLFYTKPVKGNIEKQIKEELEHPFEERVPSGIPDYDKLLDGILKQNVESKNQTDKLEGIKNALEKQTKPVGPRLPSNPTYDSADPLLNLLNYHGAWPLY
jgi:hypothetical protein